MEEFGRFETSVDRAVDPLVMALDVGSTGRVADQLAQVAGRPRRILASGRVTQEVPRLLPLVADALGTPMSPVTIKRSTLHGTAMHALEVLTPGVAAAEPNCGPTSLPRPANTAVLADRLARFEHLYDTLYTPQTS